MHNGVLSTRSPAGLRLRIIAFSLDYVLICGYIVFLAAVSTLVRRGPLRHRVDSLFVTPTRRDLVAFVTLILPVMLYFAYYESSPQRATWGKRTWGLQVVDVHGKRLSRARALTRAALKFLPWQVAHTSLFHIPGWPMTATSVPPAAQVGLGLVWVMVGAYVVSMMTSKHHQTLYDQLLGSIVIQSDGDTEVK